MIRHGKPTEGPSWELFKRYGFDKTAVKQEIASANCLFREDPIIIWDQYLRLCKIFSEKILDLTRKGEYI